MGESVTEGIVSRWLKAVGDPVKEGETVVEVTTDKVDVEVPAPASGRITEIHAAEGATVEVGAALATITPPSVAAEPAAPPVETPPPAPPEAPPAPVAPDVPPRSNVAASPLARRAASVSGVDLATLSGTGPGGLIRRADTDGHPSIEGAAPRATPSATSSGVDAGAVEPLKGPAAALIEHMERSRDIP